MDSLIISIIHKFYHQHTMWSYLYMNLIGFQALCSSMRHCQMNIHRSHHKIKPIPWSSASTITSIISTQCDPFIFKSKIMLDTFMKSIFIMKNLQLLIQPTDFQSSMLSVPQQFSWRVRQRYWWLTTIMMLLMFMMMVLMMVLLMMMMMMMIDTCVCILSHSTRVRLSLLYCSMLSFIEATANKAFGWNVQRYIFGPNLQYCSTWPCLATATLNHVDAVGDNANDNDDHCSPQPHQHQNYMIISVIVIMIIILTLINIKISSTNQWLLRLRMQLKMMITNVIVNIVIILNSSTNQLAFEGPQWSSRLLLPSMPGEMRRDRQNTGTELY